MKITKQELSEQLEHQCELLRILRRRLQQRQLQEAQQGFSTPPEIVTEIYDLSERIQQHEDEIERLQTLIVMPDEQVKYGLKITSPTPNQKFPGIEGNLTVEVSGTYEVQPPDGTTLRLFVKTEYGYWCHKNAKKIDKGRWQGRISLWKMNNEPPYEGYIIATILDEAGEDMILYADKVQQYTDKNISFDKLPHFLDKSEEVLIYRE